MIPLDAQVVLVHGTNGMGKTSVLSALELGLTGRISHLAASGDQYRSYLTSLDSGGGSIELTTTAPVQTAGPTGSLTFNDGAFAPNALLSPADARFFSERCYLPQATLGRLLEIYNDHTPSTTSPLTQFVKELLGLDPLDALVDGLSASQHLTRLRNLVPAQRRLETLRDSLRTELARVEAQITTLDRTQRERLQVLIQAIAEYKGEPQWSPSEPIDGPTLRSQIDADGRLEQQLSDLSRELAELRGLAQQWRALPAGDSSRDLAGYERNEQVCAHALRGWRNGPGHQLDQVVNIVRQVFSDVPGVDDGPVTSLTTALRRASTEALRCKSLTTKSAEAADRISSLDATIERASARIKEISEALVGVADHASYLAGALAGVAPHIDGDHCPVCDRAFSEVSTESLSVRIAAKIAMLTNEAGRLQGLATERAEESGRLAAAERERLGAASELLSSQDLADLTVRAAQMTDATSQLELLDEVASNGTELIANLKKAHEVLAEARRRDELSVSLLPDIDRRLFVVRGTSLGTYSSVDAAIADMESVQMEQIRAVEAKLRQRIQISSDLDFYEKDQLQVSTLKADLNALVNRLVDVISAETAAGQSRDSAKKIAVAADRARSDVVKTVFNTSLNKVWRDLFVRVAPSEQFVPAFKLPSGEGGKIEAVLETLHRSGKASGTPGAMLSQGNLNTAALTLFLALHLSVPKRLPWLVLDDPVQSMDDVHTAQFAALLRTLSKGLDRQLVIAVHERALFDYLTLELSPAFPGDSLITVEITRNFQGHAVATPRAYSYEETFQIAA